MTLDSVERHVTALFEIILCYLSKTRLKISHGYKAPYSSTPSPDPGPHTGCKRGNWKLGCFTAMLPTSTGALTKSCVNCPTVPHL